MFDLDDSFVEDEKEKVYENWNSIIFLIDGSSNMYLDNHVTESLETYKNIVRQKCAANKKDKIGLFLFGLKDSNCDIKNVFCLQKFSNISLDTLKNIKKIIQNDIEKYKQLASTAEYPLYDILTYASQTLHSSQKNSSSWGIIVLCTNNDNPCTNNSFEKQRIVNLVSSFKDINIELRVAGLSDNWNDEFYKDLQIISGTFGMNNYKRVHLKNFENSIIYPARTSCKLPWKISSNLVVEVALIKLVSTTTYPSKVKLEKENNEILQSNRILQIENIEDEPEKFQNTFGDTKVIEKDKIVYYQNYAGQNIRFSPSELKVFKNLGLEPGIEILAFKPIVCDPLYFIDSAYFVTNTASNNHESKVFFTSLISKCTEKKVMAICKVITKLNIFICIMIPSEDDHGFYMMKIPFSDSVRDLNNKLADFKYSSEKTCPISDKTVESMKQLMNATKMNFDIRAFKNPKLEKCIAHIEALALDEKLDFLSPDKTLPPPPKFDVKNLVLNIKELCSLSDSDYTKKRSNSQSISTDNKKIKHDIKTLAENGQLSKLTQVDLKSFLMSVNLPSSGTKAKLIERINNYYEL